MESQFESDGGRLLFALLFKANVPVRTTYPHFPGHLWGKVRERLLDLPIELTYVLIVRSPLSSVVRVMPLVCIVTS